MEMEIAPEEVKQGKRVSFSESPNKTRKPEYVPKLREYKIRPCVVDKPTIVNKPIPKVAAIRMPALVPARTVMRSVIRPAVQIPIPVQTVVQTLKANVDGVPNKKSCCSSMQEKYTTTELHRAIQSSPTVMARVQNAVETHAANIDDKDKVDEASAIIKAVSIKDNKAGLQVVKILIDAGCNVNSLDREGYTASHWACSLGKIDILKTLANAGANLAIKATKDGETPLHRASRFANFDILRYLIIEKGQSPYVYNKKQRNVLDVACVHVGKTNMQKQLAIRKLIIGFKQEFRTLVLHHNDCMMHDTIDGHQEKSERVKAIVEGVYSHCAAVTNISSNFPAATLEKISKVHSQTYVNLLVELTQKAVAASAPLPLTPRLQVEFHGKCECRVKAADNCDTSFSKGTFKAAMRAAGSICHAIDKVMAKECRNSFCVVRPPGHHAGTNGLLTNATSCGFCILNTVMIGAAHALSSHNTISKVAIVDIDVHHGNGTEDILEKLKVPDQIFFSSLHVFDNHFYPGSGKKDDLEMNFLNSPIDPCWKKQAHNSSGFKEMRHQLTNRVIPAMRAFNPDLILISAGFDGCNNDVGNKEGGDRNGRVGMDLCPEDYAYITSELQRVADICCNGQLVSVLEGGYGSHNVVDPEAKGLVLTEFAQCAVAHTKALAGIYPYMNLKRNSTKLLRAQSDSSVHNSPPRAKKRGRVPSAKALS